MTDFVEDIKAGNELSFEQAYKAYQGKVYHYFFKKTQSADDARDLLQTAFLKLWQYRRSMNAAYSFDQQLFHICRTTFIDYVRKENKRLAMQQSLDKAGEAISAEQSTASLDIHLRVGKILSQMPGIRREVFVLAYIKGYSYKEIANMLSLPVKAIDNHLAKALRIIRKGTIPCIIFLLIFLARR